MSLINIPKLRKKLGSVTADGPTELIMEGTPHETGVFVNDSGNGGPNAIILGGQHGIEPVGWEVAWKLSQCSIEKGRLVVIPEASVKAIEANKYNNPTFGNLNRKWNADGHPTCNLSREIWDTIQDYHPDLSIDLHSSKGIYRSGDGGVGQAVFPSKQGRAEARRAVDFVNEYYIKPSDFPSKYEFELGNNQNNGNRNKFSHRCGYQWGAPSYIVETTRKGTSLDTRIDWQYAMAVQLLRENGLKLG